MRLRKMNDAELPEARSSNRGQRQPPDIPLPLLVADVIDLD